MASRGSSCVSVGMRHGLHCTHYVYSIALVQQILDTTELFYTFLPHVGLLQQYA